MSVSEVLSLLNLAVISQTPNLNLGDFVCEIEREDLQAQNIGDWQAVKEAQAKLQDLKDGARKQEIAMAENSLQKAQVIFDKAQTDLKRNKELYDVGGISKQTLDDMQKAVDVAEKELYIAKENYDLVLAGTRQKQIEAQQQQVEKLIAQANANESILADTKVYSPITGVILNKNFENNEYINQGQAILTIADLTDSWVIVYIDIADLGKVYLQQKVKIQVRSRLPTILLDIWVSGGYAPIIRGTDLMKIPRIKFFYGVSLAFCKKRRTRSWSI